MTLKNTHYISKINLQFLGGALTINVLDTKPRKEGSTHKLSRLFRKKPRNTFINANDILKFYACGGSELHIKHMVLKGSVEKVSILKICAPDSGIKDLLVESLSNLTGKEVSLAECPAFMEDDSFGDSFGRGDTSFERTGTETEMSSEEIKRKWEVNHQFGSSPQINEALNQTVPSFMKSQNRRKSVQLTSMFRNSSNNLSSLANLENSEKGFKNGISRIQSTPNPKSLNESSSTMKRSVSSKNMLKSFRRKSLFGNLIKIDDTNEL